MMPNLPVRGVRPPSETDGPARTQTLVLLSVALGLRLVVVASVACKYPADWLFTRGLEMGWLARSLLAGEGLASPFGPSTGPTAFIAPGYPVFVAAVFRIFGSFTISSAIVIMLLHTVAALITVWLVTRTARALGGRGAAWVAGLIWATALPLLWVPTIFWDTSFAIAIVMGMLASVLRLAGEIRHYHWPLLGVCTGLAALVNPALLPVLACMLLWLAWQQRRKSALMPLVGAVCFAAVFAIWPIRNARVFHAFIPARTTVGYEMWMGNRPGATGFLEENLFPSFNSRELDDYRQRGEVDYTQNKAELARRYIKDHPWTFARLTGVRIWRFWSGTGSKGGSPLFAVYAMTTTLFGFAGLALLARRRAYALLLIFGLPLLVFPIPYYITHAEFRYRLVIDPILTVLTGFPIAAFRRRMAAAGDVGSASNLLSKSETPVHA